MYVFLILTVSIYLYLLFKFAVKSSKLSPTLDWVEWAEFHYF